MPYGDIGRMENRIGDTGKDELLLNCEHTLTAIYVDIFLLHSILNTNPQSTIWNKFFPLSLPSETTVSSSLSSLTNSREIRPSPSLEENQRWQEKITSSLVLGSSTVTYKMLCHERAIISSVNYGALF